MALNRPYVINSGNKRIVEHVQHSSVLISFCVKRIVDKIIIHIVCLFFSCWSVRKGYYVWKARYARSKRSQMQPAA